MTPEECLVQYGVAWFTSDRAERIEVLRKCCTEDILFMDPQLGRLHGLEEVADMIGDSMSGMSGGDSGDGGDAPAATEIVEHERGMSGSNKVGVEVVTPLDVRDGFFRYSFVWTMPNGDRHGGTDFCELADDGRMKLITVWPANDHFPLPAGAL